MFISQDVSGLLCPSTDIDMEHQWQDWINLDACTPDDDGTLNCEDSQQQLFEGLYLKRLDHNPDVPQSVTQWPEPALGYSEDWDTLTSTFEELTTLSPSSSLSSLSTSSSSSPSSSPSIQLAHEFDITDLPFLDTACSFLSQPPPLILAQHGSTQVEAVYAVVEAHHESSGALLLPPCSPPPLRPKAARSVKRPSPRPSSKRAAPYELPTPRRSSPDPCASRSISPRRSLRARGSQTYCDSSPYSSEDDDDFVGGSDSDVDYASRSSSRGARSNLSRTKLLHGDALLREIQTNTSIISCPVCGNGFSRHADVVRHYSSVHYIKSSAEILNDTSHKRLHCLGCTKILSRKDSRERHEAICPDYCKQRGVAPNPVQSIINATTRKRRCAVL